MKRISLGNKSQVYITMSIVKKKNPQIEYIVVLIGITKEDCRARKRLDSGGNKVSLTLRDKKIPDCGVRTLPLLSHDTDKLSSSPDAKNQTGPSEGNAAT